MISYTEENYLKALFMLSQNKENVSVNALSQHLQIKKPTVNSMMKRLSEKGLVLYQAYKPITLTEIGAKNAALIIRKHRLTEMYLVEKMGFGWDEVHAIAEQIEHIQSEEFFEKMDQLLGYPIADPHGSPIPTVNGEIPRIRNKNLADCKVGEKVRFNAVSNSSLDFLQFLNKKNLFIGQVIEIVGREVFDGSVEIVVDSKTINLSKIICDNIFVSD